MKPLQACMALLLLFVAADSPPLKVSVQQLLFAPEKFDGERVDVRGYYFTSAEESRLNVDQRAAERDDGIDNSIWLDIPPNPAELEFRSVRVLGTFHYRRRPANATDHRIPYDQRWKGYGSYGLWERAISDITCFQPVR